MQDVSQWSVKLKKQLEQFLSSPERPANTLNIFQLDGFIRAVNLVPEFQSLFNWSPLIFAQQNPNFKDTEDSRLYFDTLFALNNHHVDEIYSNQCTFPVDCVYSKSPIKRQQIENWCHGFLFAFEVFEDSWYDFLELYPDAEVDTQLQLEPLEEQMESILYIVETVADSENAIKTDTDPKDLEGIFETLEESITLCGLISKALIKAHEEVAIEHEKTTETPQYQSQILPFQRSNKKIGRNELCPCGSGKKFMKCCLH